MKVNLNKVFMIVFLAALPLLTACYSEPALQPVSEVELVTLYERLENSDIESPWDSLDIISGISTNTIRFIDLNQSKVELLPVSIQEKVQGLKSLGVSISSGVVALSEPQLPDLNGTKIQQEAWQVIVESRMKEIKASNEVYAVEVFSQHDKIKHYCRNECACISKHMIEALNGKEMIRLVAMGYGGLVLKDSFGNMNTSYSYHVATGVKMKTGDWGIIDPIMFGDVSPRSLLEWHSNLIQTNKLKIYVYAN
ncbi:MAG: hypothetical protein KDD37_08145 [Bdellovibrionales bacterium]|nr:hypothetical protein [Bdellovibrionales bacterium]